MSEDTVRIDFSRDQAERLLAVLVWASEEAETTSTAPLIDKLRTALASPPEGEGPRCSCDWFTPDFQTTPTEIHEWDESCPVHGTEGDS